MHPSRRFLGAEWWSHVLENEVETLWYRNQLPATVKCLDLCLMSAYRLHQQRPGPSTRGSDLVVILAQLSSLITSEKRGREPDQVDIMVNEIEK